MTTTTITQTQLRQRAPAAAVVTSPFPTTFTINSKSNIHRVPTTKPLFSIGDIRRAIPAHCFERSLVTSFRYLFTDLLLVAFLFYLSTYIPTLFSDSVYGPRLAPLLRHCVWLGYWIAQGSVLTGVWVIGHECGHGGFADSSTVNDAVGLILHSALLVPYFAWKISHRRHHSNTGSIEKDEVFVPTVERKRENNHISKRKSHDDDDEDQSMWRYTINSLARATRIVFMLTLGWPLYLFCNLSGNLSYSTTAYVNHFFPSSPIFDTGSKEHSNSHLILISDVSLIAVISIISYLSYTYSFTLVLYTYLIPYLIVNLFLVLITFLQHTSHSLPHYTSNEWDWLRGALATVDRSYGPIYNGLFHHIADTHVAHHLFSNMPHYHAEEATEAIKKILGDYYCFDETPITQALWDTYGTCKYVKPDAKQTGVFWF